MKTHSRYSCARCSRPLALEHVDSVTVHDVGTLEITYDCDCCAMAIVAHFKFHGPSLRELFGEKVPRFPWHSPFDRELSASDIDKEVRLWSWELDQITDGDDLIEWFGRYPAV